jgi:hypothetical protein
MRHEWLAAAAAATLAGCATFGKLTAPAVPYNVGARDPAVGEIPDAMLRKLVSRGDLVVLGTVVDREAETGIFTPAFQAGAKETWYSVKVVVDEVARGKLGRVKQLDLGQMPLVLDNRRRFGKLAANEIVVQEPEVASPGNQWAGAPLLSVGERAVFIFHHCYNCVELRGRPSRAGPYYKANPWVADTWGSKLPPEEWPRVQRIAAALQKGK